ncbi:alpha-galactosidase [Chitinophaga lutea]|uniref:Alpha-galactosidase n=1 Tax=Chitinophaga lutea TaxID=2488634 RepID=A0A3N4PPQ8_9BACT|nr:alpha-galactosidase [Chitinophaga lutea]RPE09708.1 alpha-galactosidase [Chitinophaga lutea]
MNRRWLSLSGLALITQLAFAQQKKDWLVTPVTAKAEVQSAGQDVVLTNGLVKRAFRIAPNVACFDYVNLSNGQQLLRAVKPEARIGLNGKEYNVGGLYGQKENAYLLPEWLNGFTAGSSDFQYVKHEVADIKPRVQWKARYWAGNKQQATGKQLTFTYKAGTPEVQGVTVKVHYALYDGIPLITKWLTIENGAGKNISVNRVVNEMLALVEEESAVVGTPAQLRKPQGIYVETNYAFNNAMQYPVSDQTTHWKADSVYTSQVNYDLGTPCLLEVYPDKVTDVILPQGETFTSVGTNELLMDSYDRERRGLAVRKMYRTIAPWTTGNPIFMHLVSKNDEQVKEAVDQCAATGYEALILSFGSHVNMEDTSAANIARWKKNAAYAHSKGILIGGYSLFSSRRISDKDDVISPVTGKPGGAFFGNAPCFGSEWGLAYRDKIKAFITQTGFDIWENDGPYPGDVCASTTHPGHKGLDDSQWRQMEIQKELYRWLNEKGVYINAPDWYFLDGTNKIALGYREVNFSLSREQQKILNRQNIFDGTWEKTPSMGWGFVPLTRYHGGGPEAVLEPLKDHLDDYKQLMFQYYGAGVQACYRGPRLYDSEETKKVVTDMVNWYKQYRDILNSDVIHLRRPDARDWDGILHANPQLKEKGLLILYNPLKTSITRTIAVPLYYTGLTTTAKVKESGKTLKTYPLNRNFEISMTVTLAPGSYSWWVIE